MTTIFRKRLSVLLCALLAALALLAAATPSARAEGMSGPGYFDELYYLNARAKQLNARGAVDGNGQPYTNQTLKAEMANSGMTPFEHFQQFGRADGLNPNPYFNEYEYMQALAKAKGVEVAEMRELLQSTGMTPVEHYEQYGWREGINPSNAFDNAAYLAARLAFKQQEEPKKGWTLDMVISELHESNNSPIVHHMRYGISEGIVVQTVPDEQRVTPDPMRVTLGEVVPSSGGTDEVPEGTLTLARANEAVGNTVTLVFAGSAPEGNVTADSLVLTEKGSTAHIGISKITFPAGGTNAVVQIKGAFTPGKTYAAAFGGVTVEFTARDGGISGNPITSPGVASPTQPTQPHIKLGDSNITLNRTDTSKTRTIAVTEYDANGVKQPPSAVTAATASSNAPPVTEEVGSLTITADSNTPEGTYTYTVTMNGLEATLTVEVVDTVALMNIVCVPETVTISPLGRQDIKVYYVDANGQTITNGIMPKITSVKLTGGDPGDLTVWPFADNTVTLEMRSAVSPGDEFTVVITGEYGHEASVIVTAGP